MIRVIIALTEQDGTNILKGQVSKMKANSIYLDYTSNLAFEQREEKHCPPISVTTKAQALKKRGRIRKERIFMTSAAAMVIAADLTLLGLILKIAQVIAIQTQSYTMAGIYTTGMCFFTLSLLESVAALKGSGVIEALSYIWKIITAACVSGLIITSALFHQSAGGSIIITAFICICGYMTLKKK